MVCHVLLLCWDLEECASDAAASRRYAVLFCSAGAWTTGEARESGYSKSTLTGSYSAEVR
jgi:hypothetical protein